MPEQLYTIKIHTTNSMIFFRGRRLRTPVTCYGVFEKELDSLKLQIKSNALKYDISIDSKDEPDFIYKEEIPILKETNNDIKIEELEDQSEKNNSILDQLLKEEKEE